MLIADYLAGPLPHWSHMNAGVVDLDYFEQIASQRDVAVESLTGEMFEARSRARGKPHNDPDPLILKTHDQFSEQHPFAGQTERAIYLIRNPRDVLISHLNYRRLLYLDDVDEFQDDRDYALEYIRLGGDPPLVSGPYGTWEQNVRSWTAPAPDADPAPPTTLLVQYEAIRREPEVHLRRMLEFLDYPIDDARVADAVARSDRSAMRRLETQARETNTFFRAREGHWFVGEGRMNQSLSSLGADVEERFLEVFGQAMTEFGYDPSEVAPAP